MKFIWQRQMMAVVVLGGLLGWKAWVAEQASARIEYAIAGEDVEVAVFPGVDVELEQAAKDLLLALQQVCGAPRETVRLAILPRGTPVARERLAGGPGGSGTATWRPDQLDGETLRELTRDLVPRWFARRPSDLAQDETEDAWFLLGLTEYLALMLPEKAGLPSRDVAGILECLWMSEPEVRAIDPRRSSADTVEARRARRLASAVWIHELVRRLGGEEGLVRLLQNFSGHGVPNARHGSSAAVLADLLDGRSAEPVAPFSFEADWRFSLATERAHPAEREANHVVPIVFTANTKGALEPCGCSLGAEGGVSRMSASLEILRGAHQKDLLVFDLGHFTPIEYGERRLELDELRDAAHYIEWMRAVEYDAITVGPHEMAGGLSCLRSAADAALPLVATGLRLNESEPLPAFKLLDYRGLRVGYVGYSEYLDPPIVFDAHEANLRETSFPMGPEALLATIAELRPQVDLLVVGGRMKPRTLRAICGPGVGVDLALLGGYVPSGFLAGLTSGFLGDTAVHYVRNPRGLSRVTLMLADEGVLSFESETIDLPETAPVDGATEELLASARNGTR